MNGHTLVEVCVRITSLVTVSMAFVQLKRYIKRVLIHAGVAFKNCFEFAASEYILLLL